MFELIFKLIIGHTLADFVLQPTSMAKGKCRHYISDIAKGENTGPNWYYWLSAHALVHGGMIWFITGNPIFGLAEVILHWIADYAKCENWTNIHTDQLIHITCKIVYAFFVFK